MATEVINLTAQDETPDAEPTEARMKWKTKKELKKLDNKTFPKKRKHGSAVDQYPEVVPISQERLDRHTNDATKIEPSKMKTVFHQRKFAERRKNVAKAIEETARAEILNEEEGGFLETEHGECSYHVKQSDIVSSVDIASATKHFQLNLEQFGPYRTNYSSNGRYLALGGRKGHVAAFDWQTKRLLFEINVMEGVRDVQFLHTETMLAVAQKNYTYIYDNTGTELHCLKAMSQARRLEFLPHHFLLVASTKMSRLHWLDVSVGKMVASTLTRGGDLSVMCQNPANAIIHTGHANGTVCMWSPTVKEPLAKLLTHHAPLRGIAVDNEGLYMYTTSADRRLRVWDVRNLQMLHAYHMGYNIGEVAVSQRKFVACGIGNTVQVFRDMHKGASHQPFLAHRTSAQISSLDFVPYEDVLGVGHDNGFTSILVPGSGEPNVDALRNNPYETKKQRREREVKQLLDKIAPEMICMDPEEINKINTAALEEDIEKKKKILWVKPPQIEFTPRHKMKGRGGGVKAAKTKEAVRAAARKENNMERTKVEKEVFGTEEGNKKEEPKTVLDRFKRKKL